MVQAPQNLQDILQKIEKLPELFHVAVMVAKMLDDEEVNAQELAKTISLDQALTTQLLKLCNSAHYGFSRKIASVQESVAKLGFKTLKSLVFMAISHGVLTQKTDGYDLGKNELWKNSVTCAVFARFLAKRTGYKDPELAFTAGLLRDIGKLMIHEYIKPAYNDIVRIVSTRNISFSLAEEEVLGFNHCTIGGAVANKWNFPPSLVDSILYHHSPEAAITANCADVHLISIIHMADSITMMLGTGIGNDGMMYNLELNSFEYLGIPQKSIEIEELISEMVELKPEIDSMVGFVNGK